MFSEVLRWKNLSMFTNWKNDFQEPKKKKKKRSKIMGTILRSMRLEYLVLGLEKYRIVKYKEDSAIWIMFMVLKIGESRISLWRIRTPVQKVCVVSVHSSSDPIAHKSFLEVILQSCWKEKKFTVRRTRLRFSAISNGIQKFSKDKGKSFLLEKNYSSRVKAHPRLFLSKKF